MTKEQLKSIFQSGYNRGSWQTVLQEVFGAKNLHVEPQLLEGEENKNIEGYKLGWLNDGDYEIGLFEYEIKSKHNIKLNRVGLRGLMRGFTKFEYDAVLTVFHDKKGRWRLSFISDLRKETTAPKRYTYAFGFPSESYRTATERLSALADTKPTFETIKEAFSVEALNDEFIKGYREQYKAFLKETKEDTKENRDYVKKLLGRLVFIQFLQKKGWMGVPSSSDKWQGGDCNYLQELVKRYEGNDRLLTEVLETLFFDTLNKERDGDVADTKLGTNIRIPYLNGGLFDKDDIDREDVDFPYERFVDLMEFFSSYNFTIDENDPDDAEVGVDPEMLGHIFENLLEDNKDKGAFYTPKEIVQYMCQQSLIEYLHSKMGSNREDIERFIRTNDIGKRLDKDNFIATNATVIEEHLDGVKICDPAIGSGAFPMGILNEIFKAKMVLDLTLKPDKVKKDIIQNSIYGVDIEKGAVDIARLRFWLSLVVDEKEPSPLPNLDYKIMQGNSLLESFEGIDLSKLDKVESKIGWELDIFGAETTSKDVSALISDYYSITDYAEKKEIQKKITKRVKEHIRKCCSANINLLSKLDTISDANAPFFLWHLYFNDVFKGGGFDIVIGNPPYIQLQANNGVLAEQLKGEKYETFARTGDIYCIFYERGLQLLRNGGIATYITSNKWMRAGYGEKLRGYLSKNNPLQLIDLGGDVFKTAAVDTNILIVQKGANKNQFLATINKGKKKLNVDDLVFISTDVGSEIWTILSPLEASIKSKVTAIGTPLKDWDIEINYGIKTGFNDAFIIDTAKRDELIAQDPKSADIIKPLLRGRDIKRYSANWADLWLIATFPALDIDIEDYPAVRDYLLSFGKRVHQTGEVGCRKKTTHKWFETQDPIGYYEDFEKEKIAYNDITQRLSFALVDKGHFFNNTVYFISDNIHKKYLLSMLNSNIMNWYYAQISAQLGAKAVRMFSIYVKHLPIKELSDKDQQPFIKIVDKILVAKKENPSADTSDLETKIDQMVYKLYNLTPDEIAIIEKS